MSKKFDPKFTRASLILLPLAKAFVSRGGDIEAILVRNGVPVRALTDPTMPIEAAACFSTVEDMAETLGDPYFAARVAIEAAKTGSPGIREAASHAVNLGDFLSRVVMEVSKQVDNVVHSVTILPDVASFETRRTVNVSGPTTQVDAVGAAFYVTVIKQGIGDAFDPRRVILNVPINAALPPGFLPKQAVIRSAIIGWRVSFPTEWLFAPFSLDWGMVASARGEFGPDRTGEAMLSYLRNVLTDNISDHDLPLNSFAAICGLHPRRLQRNLCARGTSYNQLKDEVRQSITEDLLSNTTLPIAEIALKVGLSGPAALHRAFRRWTGKTPNSFRSEAAQDQLGRGADERCEFNAGRKLERRA